MVTTPTAAVFMLTVLGRASSNYANVEQTSLCMQHVSIDLVSHVFGIMCYLHRHLYRDIQFELTLVHV